MSFTEISYGQLSLEMATNIISNCTLDLHTEWINVGHVHLQKTTGTDVTLFD